VIPPIGDARIEFLEIAEAIGFDPGAALRRVANAAKR
jgi:DNA-binding Lrp family transcriptional regulator